MRFDPDQILNQRTNDLANENPAARFPLPNHVVVRSGDTKFGFPLDQLLGSQRQAITKVPASEPGWAGVAYYLGQIWPLYWLGPEPREADGQPFILFLRNQRLGLVVEEPLSLISCECQDVEGRPLNAPLEWLMVKQTLENAIQILEAQ